MKMRRMMMKKSMVSNNLTTISNCNSNSTIKMGTKLIMDRSKILKMTMEPPMIWKTESMKNKIKEKTISVLTMSICRPKID
jgi:hypothetical protein